MSGIILGLLAETSIHPGVGQTDSAVDLPVARERTTDYPYVPGSGFKGALKQKALEMGDSTDELFGKQDSAGMVLISDARLLLLPVRSLTGAYKWLTCPHLVERYARDRKREGLSDAHGVDFASLSANHVIARGDGKLFLEERNFERMANQDTPLDNLARFLGGVIANPAARARLGSQLAVVSDNDFNWFAKHALPVDAHNTLEQETKISKSLWYEETLPPDTVMYGVVEERTLLQKEAQSRDPSPLERVRRLFAENPYLRVGGNETTGQGWFHCRVVDSE
ncbi:MAG: type III-B CRISPR module RAMP protein Cmr4 [Magnetococcus sp. YQC-9]